MKNKNNEQKMPKYLKKNLSSHLKDGKAVKKHGIFDAEFYVFSKRGRKCFTKNIMNNKNWILYAQVMKNYALEVDMGHHAVQFEV